MTWHVEHAHTPPHAWSSPNLNPSEISRMLPGRPLCPYGIFSGSTSIVLPLGRNVTLYFFVAGLYLTSSMYGFVPPIIPPKNPGSSFHPGRQTYTSATLRPASALETAALIK